MPRPTSPFRRTFPAVLLLLAAAAAHAQFNAPPTQVHDASALHPPPGARVAIVEFVDMECPVCATTTPIVEAAAAKYKIPLVRHDFLIPAHAWSPIAATNALWFDLQSRTLGLQYRDAVFAAQPTLYNNPDLLRQFTEKFAAAHHVALPFAIDPQGKLLAQVKTDSELGIRLGIEHTPTVFVVTTSKTRPYIEVHRPAEQLYTVIDQALADTGSPSPASSAPTPEPAAAGPATQPSASNSAPITAPTQPVASTPASSPAAMPTAGQPPTPVSHPFPIKILLAWCAFAAILAFSLFALMKKRKRN